jgi:hypothetical protein
MWLLDFCSRPLLHWSVAATLCLGIQSTIHADEMFLNEVMPRDIQKKTGVADLSYQQRLALEKWLNDTFVLKNQPEKKKVEASGLYLSQNLQNGKVLELNDGSQWEVSPEDSPRTAFWIVPFPLYFVDNTNALDKDQFPKKMVNQNTGVSVRVRQIKPPDQLEKLPE